MTSLSACRHPVRWYLSIRRRLQTSLTTISSTMVCLALQSTLIVPSASVKMPCKFLPCHWTSSLTDQVLLSVKAKLLFSSRLVCQPVVLTFAMLCMSSTMIFHHPTMAVSTSTFIALVSHVNSLKRPRLTFCPRSYCPHRQRRSCHFLLQ